MKGMFVVRLVVKGEIGDFKVFETMEPAKTRFNAGWFQISEYEGASAALYDVPVSGARDAVAAVRDAHSSVRLVEARPISPKHLTLEELGCSRNAHRT
ncbi:MAG: hypothetical protein E5W95_29045 [Mesorhizobium sp.]|nr:MAG: hypothetical protein E5W95_29045 [Mesorhizobium sp.]